MAKVELSDVTVRDLNRLMDEAADVVVWARAWNLHNTHGPRDADTGERLDVPGCVERLQATVLKVRKTAAKRKSAPKKFSGIPRHKG